MMRACPAAAAALVALSGCTTFPPAGYSGAVSITDDTEEELATAQVVWGEEGLTLKLTNSSGMSFSKFGIVQNDTDCLAEEADEDSSGNGCWTGEDCLNGEVELGIGPYCHSIGTRTSLELLYSDDGISRALTGEVVVVEDEYTAFPDSSYEFLVTYYLYEQGGSCWRWGLDTSYYSGLNCANAD